MFKDYVTNHNILCNVVVLHQLRTHGVLPRTKMVFTQARLRALLQALDWPGGPKKHKKKLAFTQLQALNGPVGPIQCLSGLRAFTTARFITLPQAKNYETLAVRKLAFTHLQALNGPGGPIQCLSGLLAFTLARFITLHQTLKEPAGPI